MVTREAVLAVLEQIPDPEMPIGIVDLGLVHRVDIAGGSAGSVRVTIELLPTFVGCPALEMIEREVRARVGAMAEVGAVDVRFVHDPPWSVDRISARGRDALRAHGVTVPQVRQAGQAPGARDVAVPCPFCGSERTELESRFGPTRCRMIYYCAACRNSFEHLKRV